MSKQIVVIHGGDSFVTRREFFKFLQSITVKKEDFYLKKSWQTLLAKQLGNGYDVFNPRMPNNHNARYDEWSIWFEKMLQFLQDGVVLIGHSQGGIFLAKYLSEHTLPILIDKLILVAAPHSESENLGDFALTGSLERVWQQCQNIHLFQSEDDPVVNPHEVEKYKVAWPKAVVHMCTNRGHFNQDDFPELIKLLL